VIVAIAVAAISAVLGPYEQDDPDTDLEILNITVKDAGTREPFDKQVRVVALDVTIRNTGKKMQQCTMNGEYVSGNRYKALNVNPGVGVYRLGIFNVYYTRNYTFLVTVDSENEITEINEQNNNMTVTAHLFA
jgi:subtilase family serine protease